MFLVVIVTQKKEEKIGPGRKKSKEERKGNRIDMSRVERVRSRDGGALSTRRRTVIKAKESVRGSAKA